VCQCAAVCQRASVSPTPHNDTCVPVWISKLKSVYPCSSVCQFVSVCVGPFFFLSLHHCHWCCLCTPQPHPCVCFTARHPLRLTVEIYTHPTLTRIFPRSRSCVRFTACWPPLELCSHCHTATIAGHHWNSARTATLPQLLATIGTLLALPHCHNACIA
jgi:hypothetical protein